MQSRGWASASPGTSWSRVRTTAHSQVFKGESQPLCQGALFILSAVSLGLLILHLIKKVIPQSAWTEHLDGWRVSSWRDAKWFISWLTRNFRRLSFSSCSVGTAYVANRRGWQPNSTEQTRVEFGYSVLILFGFLAVYSLIFGYSVKVRLGHAQSIRMTYLDV